MTASKTTQEIRPLEPSKCEDQLLRHLKTNETIDPKYNEIKHQVMQHQVESKRFEILNLSKTDSGFITSNKKGTQIIRISLTFAQTHQFTFSLYK